jgi:hypothetical protein
MVGDFTPPPPPLPYESPSDRRRAERESAHRTRRARKDLEEVVREKYDVVEAVEVPIKPYAPPNLIVSNRHISSPTKIYDRGRDFAGLHAGEIVKKEIKMSGDPNKEKTASEERAQRGLQQSAERQEGRAPDSQR